MVIRWWSQQKWRPPHTHPHRISRTTNPSLMARKRKSRACGEIDVDSDEDREIETSIVINSANRMANVTRQILVTQNVPPKRIKTAQSSTQNMAAPEMQPVVSSNDPDSKKCKQVRFEHSTSERFADRCGSQGASVMMQIFSKHFDSLQEAIFSTECHEHIEKTCSCGSGSATYRCDECFQCRPVCSQCILAAHQQLPFHHIQQWTGTHFARTSLLNLGYVISLGHHTQCCPNHLPSTQGRPTVIVHINGIHHTRIEYCHCAGAPTDAEQLTRARLFPATMEQPETAFSFAVLKDFHIHSLTSKKSGYDYFYALQKQTNNAFPHTTPVCHQLPVQILTTITDGDSMAESIPRIPSCCPGLATLVYQASKWASPRNRLDPNSPSTEFTYGEVPSMS